MSNDIDKKIIKARQIKAGLILKGISCGQLARKLGVSRTWMSLVVCSRVKSRRIQQAIADALEIPYEKLWGEE